MNLGANSARPHGIAALTAAISAAIRPTGPTRFSTGRPNILYHVCQGKWLPKSLESIFEWVARVHEDPGRV